MVRKKLDMISRLIKKICCLALLASGFVVTAHAQKVDYSHRVFTCDWYTREYDRIEKRHMEGLKTESVTQIRLFGRVLFLIAGSFSIDLDRHLPKAAPLEGDVVFSGNLEDLAKAARVRGCHHLFERYTVDTEEGKYANPFPQYSKIQQN